MQVAPRVGAWIEMCGLQTQETKIVRSPLAWGRGLKFLPHFYYICGGKVAPRVGAWIEITSCAVTY